MQDFKGKTILVVGGSSGIGLNLSRRLKDAGAEVIVASRHKSDELSELGLKHIEVDVTKEDSTETLKAEMPEQLNGVAYCPGTINLKPFQALKTDDFQNDFNINVLGAVRVMQAAQKPLKKAKDGSVIFYSTIAANNGLNFHASIATAKAAVQGFAKTLAAEMAKMNIRVNVLAPSLTDTPLAKNLLDTDDKKESSKKRHPLGRYGNTDDIASMAQFLLSPEASWITGQVIGIDGGMDGTRSI